MVLLQLCSELVLSFGHIADLGHYRWSQWKMEIPYWLPVVNTGLAIAIGTIA